MQEPIEEYVSSTNVRNLIFAYERQSNQAEPLEEYHGERQRSKSIGNNLSYKLFREPTLEIHSLIDIEKELVKIEAHLNYYETYEKETHVAFQEQLFNVLVSIVSIDPEGIEKTIQKKKDLIEETQKLAKILNSKLPFEEKRFYRGIRKVHSSPLKQEEAAVSSSTVRTKGHNSLQLIHIASQSNINETCKSEESLNAINDSTDLSFKNESISVDQSKIKETRTELSYMPSVSKLKKFFSFRRDEKPVRVISAAYSGVTRSQSLNQKTEKYTVHQTSSTSFTSKDRLKNEFLIETETNFKDDENNDQNVAPINSNAELSEEIDDFNEVERETHNTVSVSKLKHLFEDKHKESEEGLELLTKKQTKFISDFNIPYTEANLTAFRLKRTISGNYMNFSGLLRNVDIKKKTELNKSKSLSDLKSENLQHQIAIDDLEDDLDDKIDIDDDFEHVTINTNHDALINKTNRNESNNKQLNIAEPPLIAGDLSEHIDSSDQYNEDNILEGKVQQLKKNFENRSLSISNDEDIRHVLHRIIEPQPVNLDDNLEEPVLKIPIQLRIGVTQMDETVEEENLTNNESSENFNIISEDNEDISDAKVKTLRKTFESLSRSNTEEESEEEKIVTENGEYFKKVASNEFIENTRFISTDLTTEDMGSHVISLFRNTEADNDISVNNFKLNLKVSQENIFDEVLNEEQSLEQIDSEFEKMLHESK